MPPIRRAAATGLLALWLQPLPPAPGSAAAPAESARPAPDARAPLEAWRESQRRREEEDG
jgi:hypothetical protein